MAAETSEPIAKRIKQGENKDEPCLDEQVASLAETTALKGGDSRDIARNASANLVKEVNSALQESNKLHMKPITDETKLGIKLFVGSKQNGFHGLIKQRYTDFIVHEIDCDGKIAQLDCLEPPEDPEITQVLKLSDFIDGKAIECLSEVNDGYLNQYKIEVTGMDKEMRTTLHQAIKSSFDRLESCTKTDTELTSKEHDKNGRATKKGNARSDDQLNNDERTINEPADKHIDEAKSDRRPSEEKVDKSNGKAPGESNDIDQPKSGGTDPEKRWVVVTRRNKISRPKHIWPRHRADHTHFILYKENKDTMDAIHNLASATNVRSSAFSYAGVKDRRAVTTQWVSSWRLEPKRLIAAVRRFNKRPFIKVGNFCFKKHPVSLGQLQANKFDIVIRHIMYQNGATLEAALESIRKHGFVNYFGLQRFGTRSVKTHEIGLAVLQAKWNKAVDLILSYRIEDLSLQQVTTTQDTSCDIDGLASPSTPVEPPGIQRDNSAAAATANDGSKKYWASGAEQHNNFIDLWKCKLDAEIVFKKYPHYRHSNEGILMKSLSRSKEASQDYHSALIALPRNTRSLYVHSYQSLLWNKTATFRLEKYGFQVVAGDLVIESEVKLETLLAGEENDHTEPAIKSETETSARRTPLDEIMDKLSVVTADKVKDYSIFDVVLPLVGSRIRLPENEVASEIKRLLEEDGLNLESFKTCEKLFIACGSYRKVMVKPANVDWQTKLYSHPHQSLIDSDLDRLNQVQAEEKDETRPTHQPRSDSADEALIVSFELPPSSYATMCLREIMKRPSTDFDNRF